SRLRAIQETRRRDRGKVWRQIHRSRQRGRNARRRLETETHRRSAIRLDAARQRMAELRGVPRTAQDAAPHRENKNDRRGRCLTQIDWARRQNISLEQNKKPPRDEPGRLIARISVEAAVSAAETNTLRVRTRAATPAHLYRFSTTICGAELFSSTLSLTL